MCVCIQRKYLVKRFPVSSESERHKHQWLSSNFFYINNIMFWGWIQSLFSFWPVFRKFFVVMVILIKKKHIIYDSYIFLVEEKIYWVACYGFRNIIQVVWTFCFCQKRKEKQFWAIVIEIIIVPTYVLRSNNNTKYVQTYKYLYNVTSTIIWCCIVIAFVKLIITECIIYCFNDHKHFKTVSRWPTVFSVSNKTRNLDKKKNK